MLFKLQLKHCQSVNGNNMLNERVTQKLITSPHSFIHIRPQVLSCPVHRQTDKQTDCITLPPHLSEVIRLCKS